jgi:hypothetical protein
MDMNYAMLLLPLLLLPICARADDIYHIRPLSERELVATYETVIRDACRYAERDWHTSSFDPSAGYWGDGISDGNEGIRGISQMVLACGALLKYSDAITDAERRDYTRKATAAIRYCVSTHVTGTQNCTDGKKWGRNWQSAMWTGVLAFGAWLMWDDLDADVREDVERVVASEADRFLGHKPPTGRWDDTKAEENGWTVPCLSAAANMFPDHPHAAAWNEKAIEYMMNTLSVPRDVRDKTVVDGRPVCEWISAPNLHPDFTLENHNIFHPSYVQCSSYFLTESAMHYVYARRPVPQAATHHLMDTWRMFQTILLPWAETAFPQGMDWELHGLPPTNLFASLACYMRDPLAAEMEKTSMQYIRAWQEMSGGSLTVPGSKLGFTRHSIQAEQVTYGYLAHKLFRREGEVPSEPGLAALPDSAQQELRPPAASTRPLVRNFSSIGVILHRTESKLVTFSWKYRIMGMLIPIGEGHAGAPFFTVPITNGLVGSIELSPAGDTKAKVLERAWKKTGIGFDTTGDLLTNGGLLRQTLRVTSVGEKTVVYQDCVSALSDVSVARELGVPFGIQNDKLTGGRRTVYHKDGKTIFDWQKPQKPDAIPGGWANVDGRSGVVSLAGSGLTYVQAAGYNPQGVCADVLYGSYSDRPRSFKAGDEVARRVLLFFVEVTPDETSALAESARIEDTPDGQVLRFKLPDGGEGEVPLLEHS